MIEEFLQTFFDYIQDQQSIEGAVEQVLHDASEANLNEDQINNLIEHILAAQEYIDENVELFLNHCLEFEKLYEGENINTVLRSYCRFHNIAEDSNLKNAMAVVINSNDGDDDSDDVVFTPSDWRELSRDEIQAKRIAYEKKLKTVGKDASQMRPFLKQKNFRIGELPNPWNIKVASQVSTYDNPRQTSQRNNLGEGSAIFPAKDPRNHLLHPVCCKHGYEFSHSTRDGFHVWHKGNHVVAAPFNDTAWHTKVNAASSHTTTGRSPASLDKHLRLKTQRYKNQNNEDVVSNIPMLEQLLGGYEKVEFYKRWMEANEPQAFGCVGGSYEANSIKQDLLEAQKLRDKHDKLFGQGKPQNQWSLGDYRTESGMKDKLLKGKDQK